MNTKKNLKKVFIYSSQLPPAFSEMESSVYLEHHWPWQCQLLDTVEMRSGSFWT